MHLVPAPVEIGDWLRIASEHNLRAVRALAEIDESGGLVLSLAVESLDGLGIWCAQGGRDMASEASFLRKMMTDLMRQAAKHPGNAQRRELKGGLRVDVMVTRQDGMTKLQLSRAHTWPSATEYAVVFNNLPYDVDLDLEPERQVYGDRYYLRCGWATPDVRGEQG